MVRSGWPSCASTPKSPAGRSTLYRSTRRWSCKGKEFDEIYDLVGIRVLVDSVKDCYAALGCIHATWKPVQGRFKDYIAMPKFNLYQSLHTTVVGPQGKPLEVQIRTREMHRRAEFGIAAHWGYKETGAPRPPTSPGCSASSTGSRDTTDPGEFMETLSSTSSRTRSSCSRPRATSSRCPSGATPIDFAYAIHTEVGHRCIGARVNGRLVPLDSKLTVGRHASRSSPSKVRGRRPVARLAEVRRHAAGPQQDPPVVQPRAARGRDRQRARRADQGAAARGPAGAEAGHRRRCCRRWPRR